MLCEVITAICRNRLELVVGEARTELVSRSPAGAEELILFITFALVILRIAGDESLA